VPEKATNTALAERKTETPKMNARSWIATGVAVVLTLTAAYFGTSFICRMRDVYERVQALQSKLQAAVHLKDVNDQLQSQAEQLQREFGAIDVEKQFLANQAWLKLKAIQAIRKKLQEKSGPVEAIQDAVEDEFGLRIEQVSDDPLQFDVGPAPKLSSDPLRYAERKALWTAAASAASAFNAMRLKAQPLLEQYRREWEFQGAAAECARKKWQTIKDKLADIEARLREIISDPAQHLPDAEEIRAKLANSSFVAAAYGISDGVAFLSATCLAAAVWLRASLIAGWFRPTQVLPD